MNALYPFESHWAEIGGHNLHYIDEGAGDPLVMVHGNPTWSFFFRGLVESLRPDYRTIALDHIGCGLSDKPSLEQYPYTLDRRATDLESLLDSLGVNDRITLIVHDWGGMIGTLFATRHPERIKRLIVMNTAAFHLPADKKFPPSLSLIRKTPFGPFLVRGLNAFCLGAAQFCAKTPLTRDVRDAYLAPHDTWENRLSVYKFVQTIPLKVGDEGYDLVSQVQASLPAFHSIPMMIAWGLKDFIFDARFLQEWVTHFPNAEVHRFADAGHYLLEDKGPEVAALVREFLTKNPLEPLAS